MPTQSASALSALWQPGRAEGLLCCAAARRLPPGKFQPRRRIRRPLADGTCLDGHETAIEAGPLLLFLIARDGLTRDDFGRSDDEDFVLLKGIEPMLDDYAPPWIEPQAAVPPVAHIRFVQFGHT